MRPSGRTAAQVRPIRFTHHFTAHAEGSVLVEFGNTKVICTASFIEGVPRFKRAGQRLGDGRIWHVTAFNAFHMNREAAQGKQSGRTQEIQRLIGRALRAAVDLKALGEHTITIDCDVIQADGGTRTAAISGACVALVDALTWAKSQGHLKTNPLKHRIAAVSVGMYQGQAVCDLEYVEDSAAETDMNVVMTEAGQFIEVQGTGEEDVFSYDELLKMLELAKQGMEEIFEAQAAVLL